MTKDIYICIAKSDVGLNDVAQHIRCSLLVLIDKIEGRDKFTVDEMNKLITYLPIKNPSHIFFA